jgi:hypothetical protein
VKNIVLFLKKLLLFEIPYSILDIQNEKHAKAIRLKGEGFKPGEWKNKSAPFPVIVYLLKMQGFLRLPCSPLSALSFFLFPQRYCVLTPCRLHRRRRQALHTHSLTNSQISSLRNLPLGIQGFKKAHPPALFSGIIRYSFS